MSSLYDLNSVPPSESKFDWVYDEEPHKTRRIDILKKHPEIKKLMKKDGDPYMALYGLSICCLHIFLGILQSYIITYRPYYTAYTAILGPWLATTIMLHVHEAVHGLVFGPNHVMKNRLYGYCASMLLVVPVYSQFKKLHKRHHRYIGHEILDGEYPSELEAKFFPETSSVAKFLWFVLNPILTTLRFPMVLLERHLWVWSFEEMIEYMLTCIFHGTLIYYGHVSFMIYLVFSGIIALSTHMFGFWGVASHVEFLKHKETTSYYGWMNRIFLNFGYHMEHHDFPSVPSRLLPEITKIAPEFYEDHFAYDSLYCAVVKFLFDPKIGVRSRVRRKDAEDDLKQELYCSKKFILNGH